MKTMLLLLVVSLLAGCGEGTPNISDSYNTTTTTTSTDTDTTNTTTTTTDSGNTTTINLPPVVTPAE